MLRPDRFVAVGTSALREAGTRRSFCDAVRRLHDIDIELLPWQDEARAA